MHVHPRGEIPYDADRVLSALEGAGLQRACILSQGYQKPSDCEDAGCPSQREWTQSRNDWTLEQAKKSPNLIPICGIPINEPWGAEELERCAANGARGLKLHPASEGISLKTPAVFERLKGLARIAARFKLPILIHIQFRDEEIEAFFRLTSDMPAATFIVAHQLGQNFKLLEKAPPNVLVEISGLPLIPLPQRRKAAPALVAMWRKIGIERVLLGSDWPLLHPSEHIAVLRTFPLSREEFEKIVTKNALRLLP